MYTLLFIRSFFCYFLFSLHINLHMVSGLLNRFWSDICSSFKMYIAWNESIAFDLHKIFTSIYSLSKIAFICCINNIPPLKDSSCIPFKSCFVLNATPSGVGYIYVYLIFSLSISLFFPSTYTCPPASSSNSSSKLLILCGFEYKYKASKSPCWMS